tara:strand:+ start:431 stop:586 length:156 start_codon:yes stop_codon:yes gene_type:complete
MIRYYNRIDDENDEGANINGNAENYNPQKIGDYLTNALRKINTNLTEDKKE